MIFSVPAVFRTLVREHPHEFQVMLLIKRNNPVIEYVGSDKRILPVIQLGKPDFGISVDDRLLINVPTPLMCLT